jgi:hypothetical protein
MREYTTIQQSSFDSEGFAWFEVIHYGRITGNAYHVQNEDTAISLHKSKFK